MAFALVDLAERLDASLNPPGGGGLFVATDDQYKVSLANGFWTGKTLGLFTGYRVNGSYEIVASDGGDDLDEDQHQFIVLISAIFAIDTKILAMPSMKRAKAGPTESEIRRQTEALVKLLEQRRNDLKEVIEDVLGSNTTAMYVIDGVAARTVSIGAAEGTFWR